MVWNKVRIIIFIVLILFFSASNLHYIIIFNEKKEDHMHLYNTIKDASYKINVFKNDFINQYNEIDETYIADLIDNIDINFLYDHIGIENESEINYVYDVSVNTYIDYSGPIAGKNTNLWKMKETIIERSNTQIEPQKNIKIQEPVNINYNKYKNVVNDFRSKFNLSINAYFDIIFSIKFNTIINNNIYSDISTITLRMSLNQSIINITKTESGIQEQILEIDNAKPNVIIPILTNIAIIIVVIAVMFVNNKKKTSKTIYELNLNKIIKNYRNLIIKTNDFIEPSNMQIIDVNDFIDILEIEDLLKQPIFLFEIENKEAIFYILNYNIVYRYTMKNKGEEENEG
jgi:hypothetical protein